MGLRNFNWTIAVAAVVFTSGVVGCAIGGKYVLETKLAPTREQNTSFVFGYLDTEETVSGLQWAYLKQMEPPVFDPDFKMRALEGVFYLENVPQGTFRLDGFGGNTWSPFKGGRLISRGSVDYVLRMHSPVKFTIKQPGVYFVGAYRFIHKPGEGDEEDTFEVRKIPQPGEREVLAKIIDQAKDSAWEPVLRQYLAKL